jgi:hypothetical protein
MITDIDHGRRPEKQRFAELIGGKNVDAEEIASRHGGWYRAAEQACSRNLLEGDYSTTDQTLSL